MSDACVPGPDTVRVVERRSADRLDTNRFTTVREALRAGATRDPHRPALVVGDEERTFDALATQVEAVRHAIVARGLGSRALAVEMDGTADAIVVALGALISPSPLVIVDPAQPAARRDAVIGVTGATMLDIGEILADTHRGSTDPAAAADPAVPDQAPPTSMTWPSSPPHRDPPARPRASC